MASEPMNAQSTPNGAPKINFQPAFHAKPITTAGANKSTGYLTPKVTQKNAKPSGSESDAGDMSHYDPTGGTGHKI